MSDRYHRLQIQVAGSTWCCFGNREAMKMAIEEWLKWMGDPARTDSTMLSVNSITNTIDRAEQFFTCKMEDIQAMDVCDFL